MVHIAGERRSQLLLLPASIDDYLSCRDITRACHAAHPNAVQFADRFVNPTLNPDDLPATLLRLPHIHGPDGSECKGDESVPSILGID